MDNELFQKSRQKRMLVADDEPVTRKVVEFIGRKLGFQVVPVPNGLVALQAVRSRPYDVAILDLQMPEMDGLEAIHHIRQDRKVVQPYVIAMSGQMIEPNDGWYLTSGIDDYILKPIDEKKLVQILLQATGHQSQDQLVDGVSAKSGRLKISADNTIISAAAIDNLREIFGDEADRNIPWLISRFYRHANDCITQAWEAQTSENFEALRRIAHTLKSASATFGSSALTELTLTLEICSDAELAESASDLLTQLEVAFSRTRIELEILRQQMLSVEEGL